MTREQNRKFEHRERKAGRTGRRMTVGARVEGHEKDNCGRMREKKWNTLKGRRRELPPPRRARRRQRDNLANEDGKRTVNTQNGKRQAGRQRRWKRKGTLS